MLELNKIDNAMFIGSSTISISKELSSVAYMETSRFHLEF